MEGFCFMKSDSFITTDIVPDNMTYNGAMNLKHRLEQYWWSRGYYGVMFAVRPVSGFGGSFSIRSNLVNGMPV